MKIESTGVEMF